MSLSTFVLTPLHCYGHVPLGHCSQVNQPGKEAGSRGRHVKGFLSRRTWCLLSGVLLVNRQVVVFGSHVHKAKEFERGKVT